MVVVIVGGNALAVVVFVNVVVVDVVQSSTGAHAEPSKPSDVKRLAKTGQYNPSLHTPGVYVTSSGSTFTTLSVQAYNDCGSVT